MRKNVLLTTAAFHLSASDASKPLDSMNVGTASMYKHWARQGRIKRQKVLIPAERTPQQKQQNTRSSLLSMVALAKKLPFHTNLLKILQIRKH